MGGNAFQNLPYNAKLPRLSPLLYNSLKHRLLPRLQSFYVHIAVPAEAPEKADHGDLDFVVAGPKSLSTRPDDAREPTHEDIMQALGARFVVSLEANRTSNFAIPITKEWIEHGGSLDEDVPQQEIYCQVDIHVCADEDEWNRIVFFHAFGDLGMILGLIARNCGFSLGTKGLKIISNSANPPFHLSSSFSSILAFFDLSMDTWKRGFVTQEAAFGWAASSRFFCARRLEDVHNRSKRKERAKREMYIRFQAWAQEQQRDEQEPTWTPETVVAEALIYFNKEVEYGALVKEYTRLASVHEARRRVKSMFNGILVAEWTGLCNFEAKRVMDKVRERMGGGIAMDGMTVEEIRNAVEQAALELGNTTAHRVEVLTEGMGNVGLAPRTN